MNKPLLSISMITYNQDKYISEAIEGVLIQKTDFIIRLFITDDNSLDNTAKICQEYANKFPDLIDFESFSENKGMMANWIYNLNKCSKSGAKYIAICEGDDYWTDPLKLQKQVDFLEANPEYSLCFHNAKIIYENKREKSRLFCKLEKNIFDLYDVIERNWFIPTQSIVFKRSYLNNIPEWFGYIFNGDLALQLLLAAKGNFYYLNEVMSVYRKHATGISSKYLNSNIKLKIIEVLIYTNQYLHFEYNKPIQKRINTLRGELYKSLLYERKLFNRLLSIDFYLFKLKSLAKKIFN